MYKSSVTQPAISPHAPSCHDNLPAPIKASIQSHDKLSLETFHHLQLNHILAALPLAELENFILYLKLVYIPVGQMLYEQSQKPRYVYFPTTSVISLLHVLKSGKTSETAGVGKEGMVGIALFLGGDIMPSSAVVQISGYAYQLEGELFKQIFKNSKVFKSLLMSYTQALMTQVYITAVCNRHHNLQQQLSRWLLLTMDRLTANEITMTQDLVAGILGVRREGITEAASQLKSEGLINYRRGHITLTDRAGIENKVCECYKEIKNEMLRLLPQPFV